MGKMIGYSKSLLIPIVAIFVLTIGIISEPQNAYAGLNGNGQNGNEEVFEPTDIWCEVFGEWESGTGFWKFRGDSEFSAFSEGDAECLLIRDLEEIEIEVDVEIQGEFRVGDFIESQNEGQCKDVTTELTIFIDDESFQGTLEVQFIGEICRNKGIEEQPHITNTFQDIKSGIETMGGTGDFSNIVGGEGTFTSTMERSFGDLVDFEAVIHISLETAEPIENAIWCEGFGEWEILEHEEDEGFFWKESGDNEFFAETECLLIFDFKETEVFAEVNGQYLVGDKLLDKCRFVTTELTIFIDEEGFEGTLELEAIGEICRTELTFHEVDNTFQDLKIISGTGIFSNIVGVGTFTSSMERGGGDYETEIHSTLVKTTPIVQSGGGKGCSGECNPPTMGLNKAGDFRLVDKGFDCNGQAVDVQHFYTPFPKIENKVGEPLRCTFKIYEDSGADKIRHFEFAVGKRFGSAMSDEQGKIVWDRTFKGVESVTYDEHLFRDVSVKAMGLTKCRTVSSTSNCLLLELSATPKEPLVDDIIVKTNIWDHRRNAKQNTHNEGIEFVGMTENPLPFYTVVDGRNGITAIFTTDYSLQDLDHAIDKYGNTWTKINNIWHKDFVMPDLSCIKGTYLGYDRYCPEFNVLKQGQAEMGKQFFDSSKIVSEITEPFAYEFPDRDNRNRLAGTQLQGI